MLQDPIEELIAAASLQKKVLFDERSTAAEQQMATQRLIDATIRVEQVRLKLPAVTKDCDCPEKACEIVKARFHIAVADMQAASDRADTCLKHLAELEEKIADQAAERRFHDA